MAKNMRHLSSGSTIEGISRNEMEQKPQSAIVEMSCIEVRALIVDYLDGNLELDAYIRVDTHLEHCRHCSAIYDGIRNVVALLGSGELFQPPSGLDKRLYHVLITLG